MHFTPKLEIRHAVLGILAIAVVGLILPLSHLAPPPPPVATKAVLVSPAVELIPSADFRTAGPEYFQLVHWYNSKHWWKRNAPIVGGAGGGALIGGLAGGGTGALVGGAVGGAGGYAYKHYHHRHHHYHH
jgi:hypothetical protein